MALALRDRGEAVKRSRLYFNRKFGKYYGLEIFYGSRKQVFITFAPYVLILQYGADTSVISLLLGICAVFGMLLSPLVGRLIDRLGYKFIMVTDTLLLIVVCFFYGFSHRLFSFEVAYIVVCVNFVLDSILSLGSLASTVYVQGYRRQPTGDHLHHNHRYFGEPPDQCHHRPARRPDLAKDRNRDAIHHVGSPGFGKHAVRLDNQGTQEVLTSQLVQGDMGMFDIGGRLLTGLYTLVIPEQFSTMEIQGGVG